MKLRDVPNGSEFAYPKQTDRYLKLQKSKLIKPPETASSLTELAAKIGVGKILHCNPESEVIVL